MEGLYVRSRQENDKAFRRWKKSKVREAREAQRVHWEQVQVNFNFAVFKQTKNFSRFQNLNFAKFDKIKNTQRY